MAQMKVRFKGIADVRKITREDVKSLGVELDHDLEWSRANGYAVVMEVSPQMEEILRAQGHFSLHAISEDGSEGEVVATATDPGFEGDVIKDATTGTSTKAKKS